MNLRTHGGSDFGILGIHALVIYTRGEAYAALKRKAPRRGFFALTAPPTILRHGWKSEEREGTQEYLLVTFNHLLLFMLIYEFVYKDNANEGNENCFQIAECSLSSAKIVEKFKSRG